MDDAGNARASRDSACKRVVLDSWLYEWHHHGRDTAMKQAILRALPVLLFTAGGSCLVLLTMLGSPSFWYFPCVCSLIPIGVIWALRPPIAAPLSVGPLIASAALLHYQSGKWFVVWLLCLIAAVLFILMALRDNRGWKVPLIVSLAFVGTAYCSDRLFTNKMTIKTLRMNVAVDGKAPWGDVGPEWSNGPLPLVLYRRIGTDHCYVAFESQELRDRLAAKDGGSVVVEYNVFRDFGQERSYNIRSVDGILLNTGERVVKDAERFSGQILGGGKTQPNCW